MLEIRKYEIRMFNLSVSSQKILQFLFLVFLGIAIAKSFFVISPLFILVAAGGMLFLLVSLFKPEIGIIAIVIVISSIIFEKALPLVPIPFGSFHVTDVLLLSLLIMIPFKLFTDRDFRLSTTPLDKPLLLFYLAAIISACIAIVYFKLDFNIVMRQFRYVTYYLIYFVVTNLIREKKQIKFLIKGLFGVAVIVAIAMITQAIVGESIQLMPGRVEAAVTLDKVYEATRILPPGQTLIYVAFITAICAIAFINKPLLKSSYFYILLVVGVGVILTYNRSYWVTIIFSLSIFMMLISKRGKKRVIGWFVIAVILMSVLSFVFLSLGGTPKEYLISISDRFSSLFAGEKMFRSATLKWRRIENEYAFRQIEKYPLFGIGLANIYRPCLLGMNDNLTHYIHNGYLWIIMKMGLIGFLVFFWFYLRFLFRCFSNWKNIEDVILKSAVTGFMLSGTGILLAVMVNPIFMQWFSIVVIATMIGLTGAIIRINESEVKRLNG